MRSHLWRLHHSLVRREIFWLQEPCRSWETIMSASTANGNTYLSLIDAKNASIISGNTYSNVVSVGSKRAIGAEGTDSSQIECYCRLLSKFRDLYVGLWIDQIPIYDPPRAESYWTALPQDAQGTYLSSLLRLYVYPSSKNLRPLSIQYCVYLA